MLTSLLCVFFKVKNVFLPVLINRLKIQGSAVTDITRADWYSGISVLAQWVKEVCYSNIPLKKSSHQIIDSNLKWHDCKKVWKSIDFIIQYNYLMFNSRENWRTGNMWQKGLTRCHRPSLVSSRETTLAKPLSKYEYCAVVRGKVGRETFQRQLDHLYFQWKHRNLLTLIWHIFCYFMM